MIKRTVIVKLQPSKAQEKALFELADAGAKVWNEVIKRKILEFLR